uniref:ABC transporter domain-containing protein n=1 Tax=Amphimedon queenslandica TaxID=400682 RepID=A0A1X7V1N4_AMPQE
EISLLENGDMTLVGERGVTLSGGQKARVNLARAVYRKADIYLLDDPLSAVDSAVSRHIFEKCIRGLLVDKCVLLVTHQTQYLKQCHSVLNLMEGRVVSTDISGINDQWDAKGMDVQESKVIEDYERDEEEINEGTNKEVGEERSHGIVSIKTYVNYFKAGGGYVFTLICIALLFISEANVVATDWWVAD